jgi:hypothetical protein
MFLARTTPWVIGSGRLNIRRKGIFVRDRKELLHKEQVSALSADTQLDNTNFYIEYSASRGILTKNLSRNPLSEARFLTSVTV